MLIFENSNENSYSNGPMRLGFSFTSIPQLQISIIFGGCKDNDVLLYDHNKKIWVNQITGGKKPPARKFHAAAFIESSCALLINGGQDQLGRYCQDFYLLSLRQWRWRKIIVKGPSPCQKHAIIQKNKSQLIMFGGLSTSNESTKQIYILKLKYEKGGQGKFQNLIIDCIKQQSKNKINASNKCFSDNIIYLDDKLFVGFYIENKKGQKYFQIYIYSFRTSSWAKNNLNFPNAKIKFIKIMHNTEQTFLLTYYSKQHQQSLFYLFNHQNNTFYNIVYHQNQYIDNCDEIIVDNSSNNQYICIKLDKRICILSYAIKDRQIQQQTNASIEDFLIAIKHQQILSQQLIRKNMVLEELYKEMQTYITFLHKEYVKYDEDSSIEQQKLRHIQDCKQLKYEYKRLDDVYSDVSCSIKELRGQLGAINEDFERCMETEFDDQA